ncbi:hypothetical protein AVEN_43482-1 [Araneus ventricosus]|uniref:Uncharacterized protein n=1 Tax=Araneus ventricosus TaxID=182803 RepID=A0A4Y2GSF9_ARAVE|nr:hypothetical protein AVEN_43482-1 [Araneus ventricosus]
MNQLVGNTQLELLAKQPSRTPKFAHCAVAKLHIVNRKLKFPPIEFGGSLAASSSLANDELCDANFFGSPPLGFLLFEMDLPYITSCYSDRRQRDNLASRVLVADRQ